MENNLWYKNVYQENENVKSRSNVETITDYNRNQYSNLNKENNSKHIELSNSSYPFNNQNNISYKNTVTSIKNLENLNKWEQQHDNLNKIKRGAIDTIKQYTITKPIANAYESFMDVKEFREILFPFKSIKHAIATIDIIPSVNYKKKKFTLHKNMSTEAQRFGEMYEKHFRSKDKAYQKFYHISNGENAIRHTIWQAAITSKYGAQIARDAGDSHETRPYIDVSKRIFDKETDADTTADLLNNKIGRRIGITYPNSSNREIALHILDEFRRNGLYSYTKENDGRWYVRKKRLNDKDYYSLYLLFLQSK